MWNVEKLPRKPGKYLVAINDGNCQVTYNIAYYCKDFSKLEPSIYSSGDSGWCIFKDGHVYRCQVLAWMTIPKLKITDEMKKSIVRQDVFFD